MKSILITWAVTVVVLFGVGWMAQLGQITTGDQLIATLIILLWQQAA